MKKTLVLLALLLVFLTGCSQNEKPISGASTLQIACIGLCSAEKAKQDFSKGPCLANPLQDFPDWVCDIAHSPRNAIDNLPENQCSAFVQGKARHFVELNENCEFLRQV